MGIAAAPKVNEFDTTLVLRGKHDVFGFQIAMHDFLFPEEMESVEDLKCEFAVQIDGNAYEVYTFLQFVEIHG